MTNLQVILLLGLTALLDACSQADDRILPPLVLLTVDTLRADHLGCYGYEKPVSPNIDALAAEGIRFDNAVAPRPLTAPSMASALTGLYAHHHGVRQNCTLLDESLVSLPEYLVSRGYECAAFVSNYVLTQELSGLNQGFDHFDDLLPDKEPNREFYERKAGATVDRVLAWLAARDSDKPLFLWVHLIDPHGPYTPPEGFAERFRHGPVKELSRDLIPDYQFRDTLDLNDYLSRYDGEIAYCDEEIGRLVAGLKEADLYESGAIMFHADHGESLGEHGAWFRHGQDLFEPCVRIPFVLKLPEGTPGPHMAASDVLVSVLDVTPTLLELAGVGDPPELDGGSLLPVLAGDRRDGLELFMERKRAWGFASVGLRTATDLTLLHFRPGKERSIAKEFFSVSNGIETKLEDPEARALRESRLMGWFKQVSSFELPFTPRDVSPTGGLLNSEERANRLEALKGLGYAE